MAILGSRFGRDDLPSLGSISTWTKVLVAIGLILIVERSTTYYQPRTTDVVRAKPNVTTKALIIASTIKEDTSWAKNFFAPEWDVNIYVNDNRSAELTVFINAGHEASVYLTYIINHYWSLPDFMVFHHADRYQWHEDDPLFDGVNPIKNLRLDHVQREGYVNLRCHHWTGCPVALKPNASHVDAEDYDLDKVFADSYPELFPEDDKVPEVVAHPCCGQFALSREQILKRPPAHYERFRQWLWTSELPEFQRGRVFEHVWHMVFSKPVVHCPDAQQCYCQQYGLCDLKCPEAPGSCLGRFYQTPFYAELNPKWPEEGQGVESWPKDRWWEEYYPQDVYDGFTLRNKVNA